MGEKRNKEAKQAGVLCEAGGGAGRVSMQKEYEGDGQTDGGREREIKKEKEPF